MRVFTLSVLAISTIILAGCSKSKDETGGCFPVETHAAKINGTWEYRQAIGGICGTCKFEYPAGNGNLIKFRDNTYETYKNGQLAKRGTYRVFRDSSEFFGIMGTRIVYDNVTTESKIFIEISDNKLSFTPEVYDYQVAVYFRTSFSN